MGIEHGSGRNAADWLEAAGLVVPTVWFLRQDHPKRGLVWEAQSGDLDPEVVVNLLLRATALMCSLPHEELWLAAVSRPS